ncbi:MAG: EthD family reductase [Bacteroidetes bacterium]|nr:EthD family reductase [Bacteroidota bacterium]
MMRYKLMCIALAILGLTGCQTSQLKQSATPETGMIKVSILYPGGEGKTFDMEYYEKNHMPMMAGLLGKNLKFYEIDKGIAGRTPADKVPFVAVGYFYCYDVAEYNKVIGQHINEILADIKKYTNIQPTIQISEIRQLKYNKVK